MIGAIIGDIVGSIYELNNIYTTNFELFEEKSKFTDDTVLTVAVADSILNKREYSQTMKEYYHRYPDAGFGGGFKKWANGNSSRKSFGNGSAMRVSPIGFAYDSLQDVLKEAEKSAKCSHDHPEAIKGAQAVASAVFLAKQNTSKDSIKEYIENNFGYDLSLPISKIREEYSFSVLCSKTVPPAISVFLKSDDYESTIRNAISIGGDSDTIACICGGIAQAFYKDIPQKIIDGAKEKLPDDLKDIINKFSRRYKLCH